MTTPRCTPACVDTSSLPLAGVVLPNLHKPASAAWLP